MAPEICATLPATPSLPLAPMPVGQSIAVSAPTLFFQSAETRLRYVENWKVVPEPSERCTTLIALEGSATPGFSFLIAASSQRETRPWKISAKVGPSSTSWPGFTPGTLTTGTMPPITTGNWARPAAFSSREVSGLSVAPKVTVFALIWAIPPPEPIEA